MTLLSHLKQKACRFGLFCLMRGIGLMSGFLDMPPANAQNLVAAARAQIGITRTYDGRYARLAYPMGDVDPETGVCTDVIIRAFRQKGIDLQERVHEDMRAHFDQYPPLWGLKRPDPHIDHRRVPNLETYFKRQGYALPAGTPYQPGDIVTWRIDMVSHKLPHIAILSARPATADGALLGADDMADAETPGKDPMPGREVVKKAPAAACTTPTDQRLCVIHNWGNGTQEEDALPPRAKITGHYRPAFPS